MKIKLLKSYSLFCAGDVIDTFDEGVCVLLIARGIAEECTDKPRAAQVPELEPRTVAAWNKMMAQPEPRRERNGRR